MSGLMRHIEAATALRLPGQYLKLSLGGAAVGYVLPAVANRLWALGYAGRPGAVLVDDAEALARAAAVLADAGCYTPRGEDFDVRALPGGTVLARVDRGAVPVLGIAAEGVHVNGLVHAPGGLELWVGKRSAGTRLDPGKLDHLVAGGIAAGMDAETTLVKEAAEEAGIPAALARQARHAGTIGYTMERPDGLRRDRLHCFDLEVPPDFVPAPHDGEADSFARMGVDAVLARVRDTDDFKFNVNFVLIDLFARLGMLGDAEARGVERLRK
jgi:8-oxo-dGTP pyrophosphatase MutT (NUDIX family)